MTRGPALFVALLMAAVIVRTLVTGSAAAGNGLHREDEPLVYWGSTAIAAIIFFIVLYLAWNAKSF